MAEHETIADIAAEKRRIAKEVRDHASNGDYWDKERANENAEALEEEADRLEAALERERGDEAKLREALTKILNLTNSLDENCAVDPVEIRDIARAALSAPPRNCDRYATAEEARQAWLDDAGNWDEFGSPKLELHDWLLATATEKEGGAK